MQARDLKNIIESENHELKTQFCNVPFTITPDRNIYNIIRNKYKELALEAQTKFAEINEQFEDLDDLINNAPSAFVCRRSVSISTDCPCSIPFQRFSMAASTSLMAFLISRTDILSGLLLHSSATRFAIYRILSSVSILRHSLTTRSSIYCLPIIFLSHFFLRAFLHI